MAQLMGIVKMFHIIGVCKMSLESRLKKLESHLLKSGSYIRGMRILEEITEANATNNRELIPSLLIKLWKNGRKTA